MESIIGKILCDRYRIIQELKSQSSLSSVTAKISPPSKIPPSSASGRQASEVFMLDRVRQIYLAEDLVPDGWGQCLIRRYQPQSDNEVLGTKSWQEVYQAFMTQAKILQKVSQHPQITQLLAFFECDREFYLVVEPIEGESLEQKVSNSLLNEEEAIVWLQEVAGILGFIHQAGVAHLNLQPSSLIQHRDGRKLLTIPALIEHAILTDFPTWQNSVNPDLFPLDKTNLTSFQSDIYALGQTVIYALSGNFLSSTSADAFSLKNLDKLSSTNIHPELSKILRKMVNQNTEKCYQNINQLLTDLDFEQNVVTLPPPFFGRSNLAMPSSPRVKKRTRKSNKLSTPAVGFQFKQIQPAIWLWLSLPFIIACIIIFVGINKNSRSQLTSYVNDDYQFAIKYPPNWSQRQLDDPITGEIVVFASPQETAADLFRENLSIAVEYLSSEPISLEQYTQDVFERINQAKGSELETYEDYRTTVDNLPARKVIYSRQEAGLQLKQMETFTIRNNQVYIAIYTAERAKFSKFHDTVEQMIESWEIQ